MRLITFSYPTETAVEVCATQTTTAASQVLILNGGFSNIAQLNGPTPFVSLVTLPGIQRSIQISSTGNISTSTFTISGRDLRGTAFTTTLAGPTGTLIPTHTTQEFNTITAISVATLASSSFTIGVGATGSSNWVHGDGFVTPFSMSIAVTTGTSQPVTIQDTPDDANSGLPVNIFSHATLATVTVSAESNYAFPVNYTRAIFTATAVGAATSSATTPASVTFFQAGA